ncbi:MAG: NAD(P)H-dependent oxidoreductase [Ginsengibacter sp.]
MYKLKIIIASTREGRKGISVGNWFAEASKKYPDFETEVLDLAVINLPMMNEPNHPRLQQYTHDYTKKWSAQVDSADAFVVVVPEYNYSMPPALLNAIDFLYKEWLYKPVGIVSYGGVSGGLRSAQSCKGVMNTLKLVPLPEGVMIPFFDKKIDENGVFHSDELIDKSVAAMMKELLKWTNALKPMRDAG